MTLDYKRTQLGKINQVNGAETVGSALSLWPCQDSLWSLHHHINKFSKTHCPFPLFPFQSGSDKIPLQPFLPKQKDTNPDREVKCPNKREQSKTCQGQDRPWGASKSNKLSRYSLNLLHWFADRGSLAPSKNDPFWTPLSVSAVHFEIPY